MGTLRGTVTDPSAAVIPNATVVATGNGQSRSVKTDGQGKYTIPNVAPGKYDVRADAAGFVPYISNGCRCARRAGDQPGYRTADRRGSADGFR